MKYLPVIGSICFALSVMLLGLTCLSLDARVTHMQGQQARAWKMIETSVNNDTRIVAILSRLTGTEVEGDPQ